jgi:hypothetical protein
MSKLKINKLAHRHYKYALLAYAVVAILLIAVVLKPSQVFIWATGITILLILIVARYHVKQGHLNKDALLEYILVLIATLAILIGAVRH